MKLPRCENVVIEREKIADYLLDEAHPDNGGKALFFLSLGFTQEEWELLAAAFRKLAVDFSVARSVDSSHGLKYVVDGEIETPSGKTAKVRTVWIVDRGLKIPRLVTAYPRDD